MGLWDTPQIKSRYTHGYTLDTPLITPNTPQIHPGLGVAKAKGLGGCVRGASGVYPGVHMGCILGVSELYLVYQGCSQSILVLNPNNFISKHCF